MTIPHEQDVQGLPRVGAVVAEARDVMRASVRPGVTTVELDSYWADTGAGLGVVAA
jgi:methionine aminopeptidase